MINDFIKKSNEDVNQDVSHNMCDKLVTKFPTQRKDGQDVFDNYEEARMLK